MGEWKYNAIVCIVTIAVIALVRDFFGNEAARWLVIGAICTAVLAFWEAGANKRNPR